MYFHFYTAPGIGVATSTNLSYWKYSGTVMSISPSWKDNYPSWTQTYLGSESDGNLWAPDIIYFNETYYLYYSVSSFGSSRSAIGLLTSNSLKSPNWVDQGIVVSSNGLSTAINAIDPGIFRDDDRRLWMTYGSWFGGIGVVELDTITGKAIGNTTHVAGGGHVAMEAPYIFKENNYYYLVLNRGTCCDGVNSTYYITVGRSTSVTGPYDEFRTLLENKDGRYVGPGHFSLFRKDSCFNYVSIHYYNDYSNGYPTLDILQMQMVEGWPQLSRSFVLGRCYELTHINKCLPGKAGQEMTAINIRNSIHITLQQGHTFSNSMVEVYSMNGMKLISVKKEYNSELEIPHNLQNGIYIVKVQADKNIFTDKVFVNN